MLQSPKATDLTLQRSQEKDKQQSRQTRKSESFPQIVNLLSLAGCFTPQVILRYQTFNQQSA